LVAAVNRLSTWSREHRWVSLIIQGGLILIALTFVGFYIQRDWHEFKQTDLNIHWGMAGLSFVLYGLNYLCFIIAWHLLVRSVDKTIGWTKNSLIYSYSHLARFLPSPAWFIASRAILYSQAGMRKRSSLTLTAVETLLHFALGLSLYCMLSIDSNSPLTFLYLFGLLPALAVIIWPQLLEMGSIYSSEGIKYTRGTILVIELLLLLTWITAGFFFNLVIFTIIGIQVPVSMVDLWKIWIVSNLIAYIGAYIFGGVSIFREFSLVFLLGKWFTPPIALGIAIVSRLVMTVAGIFWAFLVIGFIKALDLFFPGKIMIDRN
jgi:hypothetical protein